MKLNPTTNCGCCDSCKFTIRSQGCSTDGLPGTLVQVYSDAGFTNLVSSGITDATGNFVATIPGVAFYWIQSTPASSRLAVFRSAAIFMTCGGSVGQGLFTSPGYRCLPQDFGCALPVSETLTWTDSTYGSRKLTWVDFNIGWISAPALLNVGACIDGAGVYPPRLATFDFAFLSFDGRGAANWFGFIVPGCPDDAGLVKQGFAMSYGLPPTSCPPAFVLEFTLPNSNGFPGGATGTITE